jgi:hypothetical protein
VGGCNYRGRSECVRRAAAVRRKWDAVKGRDALLPATTCTGARSARHHVTLLISISFLFSFFFVVVLIASRSIQHVLRDTRRIRTTRPNHTHFRSRRLHFPFILHLWSRTLEQRLPTLSHYHAASVCSLIHPHSPFPLYAYTLYSIPITGTSEIASTIQISYSSRMASTLISSNQVLPSFPSYSVLSIIGDPFVELLSTRSRPIPLSRLSFSD